MNKEIFYTFLTATFCVCLIASNIFETVIFNAGPLTLTGGFLIFPIIYIVNDCLSEAYGYKKTKFAIILAFALNLVFVLIAQLITLLPESYMSSGIADSGISPQQHFTAIFKADLRISAASMAAFIAGSLVNARVMVSMRNKMWSKTNSKLPTMNGFGFRAIISSLAGESIDSLVFFPIAFHGVGFKSMIILMGTQVVLKTAYEIIVLPLTTIFVNRLNSVS